MTGSTARPGAGSPTAVVVGAGVAGAACAGELAAAGVRVRLLDRGYRPGGRLATRRLRDTGTPFDGHLVDIGASYLTAHEREFRVVVDDWAQRGLVRGWTDTFHMSGPDGMRGTTTGPLRYAAPGGLRSLVQDLIDRLPTGLVEVVSQREVETVCVIDGVTHVDGEPADRVALCLPDPQARRLLDPTCPELDPTRRATEGVLWEPVLVLVAVFEQRCWEDLDGVFVNDDPVLTWIADDGRRRGDGAAVLVAHAQSGFAAGHPVRPDAAAPELVAALHRVLDIDAEPAWVDVKRWTCARPVTAWPDPFHLDPLTGVGLAGDGWHAGPRVECAYLSGAALGRALAARP